MGEEGEELMSAGPVNDREVIDPQVGRCVSARPVQPDKEVYH